MVSEHLSQLSRPGAGDDDRVPDPGGPERRSAGRRYRWLALAAVVLAVVAGSALLASRQAMSWDETQTLAQTHDPTLDTLRANCASTLDTCPAAYYGSVWALSRAGVGFDGLRAVSIAGWATASLALGAIALRRGGRIGSVVVAAGGLSASGLFGQSMVARPYGLAVGALAGAVWVWERSFARPSRWGAALLAAALTGAIAVHYASVVSVGCLLVAELLALRWDRARSRWYLGAFAAALVACGLLGRGISQSVHVAQGGVNSATVVDVPSFYLSILRPVALPLLVVGVLGGLGWLVRRRGAPADRGGARRSPARALVARGARRSPYTVAIVLLAALVPLVLVVAVSVADGQYVHRYALGGLVGVVLVAAEVIRHLERSRPVVGPAAAVVVLAAIPLAWSSAAANESPTRREVAAVARATGVTDGDGTVVVVDPYLRALLVQAAPGADHRLVLAGPPDTVADEPAFDLTQEPKAEADPVDVLLVATGEDLAALEASGRVVVHRRVGSSRLTYGVRDDEVVGAEVALVPE